MIRLANKKSLQWLKPTSIVPILVIGFTTLSKLPGLDKSRPPATNYCTLGKSKGTMMEKKTDIRHLSYVESRCNGTGSDTDWAESCCQRFCQVCQRCFTCHIRTSDVLFPTERCDTTDCDELALYEITFSTAVGMMISSFEKLHKSNKRIEGTKRVDI